MNLSDADTWSPFKTHSSWVNVLIEKKSGSEWSRLRLKITLCFAAVVANRLQRSHIDSPQTETQFKPEKNGIKRIIARMEMDSRSVHALQRIRIISKLSI